MYICNDCGCVFESPRKYTKNLSVGLCHFEGCPDCGKDDYEETNKKCPFTDEFIHPSKDLSDNAKRLILDDLNAILACHVGAYREKKKAAFEKKHSRCKEKREVLGK